MPGSRQGGGVNQANEFGGLFNEVVANDRVAYAELLNAALNANIYAAGVHRLTSGDSNLNVADDVGMIVQLSPGQASLGVPGSIHTYLLTAPRSFTVEAAHPTADRIDVVGLHMDASAGERVITAELLKGTPAVPGSSYSTTTWSDVTGADPDVQMAMVVSEPSDAAGYTGASYLLSEALSSNRVRWLLFRKKVSDTTPLGDYRIRVVQDDATDDMSIEVIEGDELTRAPSSLSLDETTYQYYIYSTSIAYPVNVIAQLQKAAHTSVVVSAGDPPQVPTHSAGQGATSYWLPLAEIEVGAAVTTIEASNITDRRVAARQSQFTYVDVGNLSDGVLGLIGNTQAKPWDTTWYPLSSPFDLTIPSGTPSWASRSRTSGQVTVGLAGRSDAPGANKWTIVGRDITFTAGELLTEIGLVIILARSVRFPAGFTWKIKRSLTYSLSPFTEAEATTFGGGAGGIASSDIYGSRGQLGGGGGSGDGGGSGGDAIPQTAPNIWIDILNGLYVNIFQRAASFGGGYIRLGGIIGAGGGLIIIAESFLGEVPTLDAGGDTSNAPNGGGGGNIVLVHRETTGTDVIVPATSWCDVTGAPASANGNIAAGGDGTAQVYSLDDFHA